MTAEPGVLQSEVLDQKVPTRAGFSRYSREFPVIYGTFPFLQAFHSSCCLLALAHISRCLQTWPPGDHNHSLVRYQQVISH
jgi:hypothetical protein